MPIFQSLLTDSYNSTEETILVEDSSNYTTNTQTSHALSEFDASSYIKIEIVKPDASTFVWSNQPGSDVLIPSPSVSIFDGALVLLPSDVSGDYNINLTTVPSWDIAETYSNADSDTVYHSSNLWESTGAGITSEPIVGNPDWSLISITSLNAKYTDTDTLPVVKAVSSSPIKYNGTFKDDGVLGISVDSSCSSIKITDNSNYINGSPGHSQSNFSEYRFLQMTKPGGSIYIFSSVEFDDIVVDQIVAPASSGSNDMFYLIDDQMDKDGIYEFKMCNYPTWNISVGYTIDEFVVVFHEGELYKLIADSTGEAPNDPDTQSWELYVLLDPKDEYLTKYCTCAKIAVLCINTYECLEKLTRNAFCNIKEDFCNDDLLCENKAFLDTVKMRIMIDEIGYSVNREEWGEVKEIFNLMQNICGCLC